MDSSTRSNNGSFWTLLVGASLAFVGVGSIVALWMSRTTPKRAPGLGDRLRRFGVKRGPSGDFRRAGRATARGLGAGLGAAWDVAIGGADAVRARAAAVPTIVESAQEASESLASAFRRFRKSTLSFISETMITVVWVSAAGLALLFLYLPESQQRQRFFTRTRRWYNQFRQMFR